MIGRLLSARVDVFHLNFSHVAQADHVVVAEHLRPHCALASAPDGGIGPSTIGNMCHGAACVVALLVPWRHGPHWERYCDVALVIGILPYFNYIDTVEYCRCKQQ